MPQFNASTNSLYADALFWSGATSDTYPVDPDFTRNANFALDLLASVILKFDGQWDWKDDNLAGELIDGTTNLVAGTAKYAVSIAWLKVMRVRVKDPNGNWITLKKYTRREFTDSQLAESGVPYGYYFSGGYVYLVANPNYSASAGVEIQMQKGADPFVVGDTSKVPGILSPFHRLISLMAAADWCEANEMNTRAAALRKRIGSIPDQEMGDAGSGMLREMATAYSDRDKDGNPRITIAQEDFGQGAMEDGIGVGNPRAF